MVPYTTVLMHGGSHSVAFYLVKPQCSDISLDNHYSVICTSSSIFQDRDKQNNDPMFQVYD